MDDHDCEIVTLDDIQDENNQLAGCELHALPLCCQHVGVSTGEALRQQPHAAATSSIIAISFSFNGTPNLCPHSQQTALAIWLPHQLQLQGHRYGVYRRMPV